MTILNLALNSALNLALLFLLIYISSDNYDKFPGIEDRNNILLIVLLLTFVFSIFKSREDDMPTFYNKVANSQAVSLLLHLLSLGAINAPSIKERPFKSEKWGIPIINIIYVLCAVILMFFVTIFLNTKSASIGKALYLLLVVIISLRLHSLLYVILVADNGQVEPLSVKEKCGKDGSREDYIKCVNKNTRMPTPKGDGNTSPKKNNVHYTDALRF